MKKIRASSDVVNMIVLQALHFALTMGLVLFAWRLTIEVESALEVQPAEFATMD